jgi:hypothetical protein
MIEFKDLVSDDFSKKMPLRYYPRRLRIKAKKEFETPVRAITDSEYKAKMNFPNQIKLPDSISIDVQYFNQDKLKSFINENGAMKKLKDNVLQFSKSATDSYLSILSLRQQQTSLWPELNENQFSRFMRFLDNVQSGINTKSMPEVTLNFEYEKAVEQFCMQYQESNPIVWIDLREKDEFKFKKKIEILKTLVKDEVLQMIGFYAGQEDTWDNYNVNLDYLYTELGQKQVLLLYEGSYKSFSIYYSGVSKLHYHPFEVFDVISPYRFPRGREDTKKSCLDRAKNKAFLDTDDVSLKKFDKIGRDKIELYLKYLDTKSRTTMKEIIDKIDGSKEIDKDEVNIFTSFANIEQVIAGYNEMNEISKRIEGGETYNYLEEKKGLEKEVENRLSAKTGNVMKFFEEDE